ncbi:MAG TPA: hypothetical protein VF032_12610 [Thermoleophilaceae bacterium]
MQSVHAPHLILGALAACAAALALFLTLGHQGPRHAPSTHGLALIGGKPLQQARCQQWLGASPSERARGIQALHGVVGGPTPFGRATALTSAEAERLFDRTCANGYARNFLLYELYTRAAGFRSVVDPHV